MCAICCRLRGATRARRRSVLKLLLLSGPMAAGMTLAQANVDTLKVVIGANVGGGYDLTGRSLGAAMIAAGEARNAIYDNKAGAGGTVALSHFARAEHGNPSALMVVGAVMVGAIEAGRAPVSLKDATPVARLFADSLMVVVPAQSPIRGIGDLISRLKSAPGAVSWAGGSRGSIDHMLAGLMAKAGGVDPARLNYVPFAGGSEVAAAILSGHVTVGVTGASEVQQHVNSGKMRALAVSSATPLGRIRPLKEQGLDVEVYNWRGVYGAPGISNEQRDALISSVLKAVANPGWKDVMQKNEWSPFLLTGDEFGSFVEGEQKRMAGVLRDLGVAAR